jgi:hypothetical protein
MVNIPDYVASLARSGHDKTGIPTSVILAQWILETGGFTSRLFLDAHNFAGIKYHGAYEKTNGFSKYPDINTGFNDWVRTINLSYYTEVRTIAKSNGAISEVIKALGASPWDADHYNNGKGPGSSLLALWSSEQLGVFDTPLPTNAMTGIVSVVVGQPVSVLGDETIYHIKPEYAGESLVKINDETNHLLGRTDILAGFLGLEQNSPIPEGQGISAANFPRSYIPDSTEWKGFKAVFTDQQQVYPAPNVVLQVTSPEPVKEEENKRQLMIAIFALFIGYLDKLVTKIRKFAPQTR